MRLPLLIGTLLPFVHFSLSAQNYDQQYNQTSQVLENEQDSLEMKAKPPTGLSVR